MILESLLSPYKLLHPDLLHPQASQAQIRKGTLEQNLQFILICDTLIFYTFTFLDPCYDRMSIFVYGIYEKTGVPMSCYLFFFGIRTKKADETQESGAVHASKFSRWFSEEERKPIEDLSPGQPADLLSLIQGGEKGGMQVFDLASKNLTPNVPFENPKLADMHATSSLTSGIENPKQFLNNINAPAPVPSVLTREDLEKSILSESNEIASIDSAPRDSREVKVENGSGKSLTLEALFGNAFMRELQLVGAPASPQKDKTIFNRADSVEANRFPLLVKDDGSLSGFGGPANIRLPEEDGLILIGATRPMNHHNYSPETPVAALRPVAGGQDGRFFHIPRDSREPNIPLQNLNAQPSPPQLHHQLNRAGQFSHPQFMAREGMIHQDIPNHQFPPNMVGPIRFSPSVHPMLQQLHAPGKFPPHLQQGFPSSVPLPHSNNPVAGFIQELNPVHGFHINNRQPIIPGLGLPPDKVLMSAAT